MPASEGPVYDAVVVGTGMGGATAGYELARRGRTVLFLESGRDPAEAGAILGRPPEAEPGFATDPEDTLARAGRCSADVKDAGRGDSFTPQIGAGTGGSSALYGGALERLFPRDFDRWPFDAAELQPWYDAAERLFRVTGTPDPLRPSADSVAAPENGLSAANCAVFDHLRARGLHPYRLHLAMARTPDCRMCQGYLCAASCKRDARTVCVEPALGTGRARLLTRTRAERIAVDGSGVARVHAQGSVHRGRVVIVAAGALATPRILQQSGGVLASSPYLGRCLMRHRIRLFVLAAAPRLQSAAEAKELGLTDFYSEGGAVQSFGVAPPLEYLRNQPGSNVWRLLGPLAAPVSRTFRGAPIIAAITEDDPNPANCVSVCGGSLGITYSAGEADLRRARRVCAQLMRAFARYAPVPVFGTSDRKALGHVCGTARLAAGASEGVADPHHRVHGTENVFIADASFFPTSGGVNPALTVAACGLRLAAHLDEVL